MNDTISCLKNISILFLLLSVWIANGQCLLNHAVQHPIINEAKQLQASHTITANSSIEKSTVIFQAGNCIEMQPSFEVAKEATLEAIIADCPDDIPIQHHLGNIPIAEGITGKARNIWDLQLYNDKIFLGYGSTTQNTGPTSLWAFDTAVDTFVKYCTIPTEAIERLRVWNDTLVIPNADPKPGDLYKFTYWVDGQCKTHSLAHPMAHVRDIYYYNKQYFLAGNTRCPGSEVADCSGLISIPSLQATAYNKQWLTSELTQALPYTNNRWNWFFGFLAIDSTLILPNAMFTKAFNPNLTIQENAFYQIDTMGLHWSAYQSPSQQLQHFQFYPVDTLATSPVDEAGILTSLRPHAHVQFKGKALYTLRSYSLFNTYYQEAYNNSCGMVLKDSLSAPAQFVTFPDAAAIGEDLLLIEDRLYALTNSRLAGGQFKVSIYATDQPSAKANDWVEVLHFISDTMARSFEYHQGYFYFGLGRNEGDAENQAGQLLRIHMQ